MKEEKVVIVGGFSPSDKKAIEEAIVWCSNYGFHIIRKPEVGYPLLSECLDFFKSIDEANMVIIIPTSYEENKKNVIYEMAYSISKEKRILIWGENIQSILPCR